MTDPVMELEFVTELRKREDESVREYVVRVGEAAGVDDAVAREAATYVDEWHYGPASPPDDEPFETFLTEVRRADLPTDDLDARKRPVAELPSRDGQTGGEEAANQSHADADPSENGTDSSPSTDGARGPTLLDPDGTADSGSTTGLTGEAPTRSLDEAVTRSAGTAVQSPRFRRLLVRFLLILVAAPVVGWTISRAWVPGNRMYGLVARGLAGLLGLPAGRALLLVGAFGLGLYVTVLALLTVDLEKRLQGVLLIVATAVALPVLAVQGVFITHLDPTPLNLLGVVIGVVVGLLLEADQLVALDLSQSTVRRPTLESGQVPSFGHASTLLLALVASGIGLSVLQVVLAGVATVLDVVGGAVFLALLYGFLREDASASYVLLGPERSGKSTLLMGLCLRLEAHPDAEPRPNAYLASVLERVGELRPDDDRWPLPSTAHDKVRVGSFELLVGQYLPRRLELTTLDYAGQHLARIAEVLEEGSPDDDSVAGQVAAWVADANTLLLVVDAERLVYPESLGDDASRSWGIEQYATILEATDPDDVVVVATKCDILVDQDRAPSPAAVPTFEAFAEAVTDALRDRPDVDQLLARVGEETVQPVYIDTTKRDEKYVPRLDEDGNLVPVGYDHLLAELRARQ